MNQQELNREQTALLAEILGAFAEVSREGGVSWSESKVLDRYGGAEECAAARRKDKDSRWEDLLEDGGWTPRPGIGGFSFLDDIGLRYYLPVGLSWGIRHAKHLDTLVVTFQYQDLSILDERQARCCARYMRVMRDRSLIFENGGLAFPSLQWQELLDHGWSTLLKNEPPQ